MLTSDQTELDQPNPTNLENMRAKQLIAGIAILAVTVGAFAQGQLNSANRVGTSPNYIINAPITDVNGTTLLDGVANGFWAQIYAGATAVNLVQVDVPMVFRIGAGAGYYNYGADPTRTVNGIAAGAAAFVQVRAWAGASGSTYESIVGSGTGFVGESAILQLQLGGGLNPPANLIDTLTTPGTPIALSAFSLHPVPEPSVVALGVLGALVLLFRRRK
jgi:hypothetical protein